MFRRTIGTDHPIAVGATALALIVAGYLGLARAEAAGFEKDPTTAVEVRQEAEAPQDTVCLRYGNAAPDLEPNVPVDVPLPPREA